MSSNLVKGGYVVVSSNEKIAIDNNEIIRRKLEELKQRQLEEITVEPEETVDGFVEGIDPIQVARLVEDSPENNTEDEASTPMLTQEDLENEMSKVRLEGEQILNEARAEAENIKANAKNEGFEAGYNEGISKAEAEIQNEKAKLEAQYNDMRKSLEAEFNEREAELEPMLIAKLTEIYEHILGVSLSDSTSTVVFLLKKSLSGMDSNRSYIIHVSKEDYDIVRDNKSQLSKASGIMEDSIEIIEDHSLNKNGCMIESDSGIFDVGLDTQMSLLKKQLKILSMSIDSE